jgi:hypothetical protein
MRHVRLLAVLAGLFAIACSGYDSLAGPDAGPDSRATLANGTDPGSDN